MNVFHNVPRVPRKKMERWNAWVMRVVSALVVKKICCECHQSG
jgi:hypothetical protein